jgi:hypothetical protein
VKYLTHTLLQQWHTEADATDSSISNISKVLELVPESLCYSVMQKAVNDLTEEVKRLSTQDIRRRA